MRLIISIFYPLTVRNCNRVLRSTYTKIWLEGQPPDADMNDLTTRFQDQGELFGRMFERFEQGYSHVKASLEAYLCDH